MFESLSEKLQGIFQKLTGKGKLTEKDVDEALRQVRLALLEADVNFKVVKDFVTKLRARLVGSDMLNALSPAQHVIKIVNEELVGVLGGARSNLTLASQPPTVIMLVGLQGSGKTTTAAKLGLHLRHSGQRPLLAAADVQRPAAVTQLITLGKQLDIPVYSENASGLTVAVNSLKRARDMAASAVIIDTQGRLHVDKAMMAELVEIKAKTSPQEVLLVADAMTGQDAVRAAEEFHAQVGLTGLILTKMDGDARGGAALSIKAVTGVPIKFIGTGEKTDALEPFHPDRLASRILGMGDMLSLIEKAEAAFDEKQVLELQKKVRQSSFDLSDFLEQLQQIKKMGPLSQIVEMIPGLSALGKKLPQIDERQTKKVEAIIRSMTLTERQNPSIIDGSRRRRIAAGSGTSTQDVNQLLNQFRQMQKLMKQMAKGKMPFSLPQ
ncbi:MAG: signal recognition particle protein [Dehalococcoidia bacterium]|nr:signal recognition particle protein [Dehalococcoidia bacterium]